MARQKTSPNKAESKQIGIALNEHKALISTIEWDGEGENFAFIVTTTDEEQHQSADLQEAIAAALDHMQEAAPEAVEEAAEADEAEATEEATNGKTIVPKRYRDEYKARGDARSNGDWFAKTFKQFCNGSSKKAPVDLGKVYAIARANGVDKEWPGLNNGQQRMNAGNMVRRKVMISGVMVIPAEANNGEELKLDGGEWAAEQRRLAAAKKAAAV